MSSVVEGDFVHEKVAVRPQRKVPSPVSAWNRLELGVHHCPITTRNPSSPNDMVAVAERAVGRVGHVHGDPIDIHVAQQDILAQVLVVSDGAIPAAKERPVSGVGRETDIHGARERDAGNPVVSGAVFQELIFGGVKHVVRRRHAANDDIRGAAHRVYVDVVAVAEDGQQAQLDGVVAREEWADSRGDGLGVAQRHRRHGIATVLDGVVRSAAPYLPRVGHPVRRVDGRHVRRVHAPSGIRRLDGFIARPRFHEVVVRYRCDPRGIDNHHAVRAVECRAHGEAADPDGSVAHHVAAVPYHLVPELARSAFVAPKPVLLEVAGVRDVAQILDRPFRAVV